MPRSRTKMTDDAIEQIFEDFGVSLTIDDLVFTGDTIDDFVDARSKWAELGVLEREPHEGFDSIVIENGQPRKGMARGQTIVIDLGGEGGGVRVCYSDHTTH